MDDYINRAALLEEIRMVRNQSTISKVAGAKMETIVKDQPAANVVPVRHGRWIPDRDLAYCSLCRCEKLARDRYNYCPHCGAKMDGEVTDHE